MKLPIANDRGRGCVVHVITRLIAGGADENTVCTCNGQAELGYSVYLVHGHTFDDKVRASVDERVELICIESLVQRIAPSKDMKAMVELVRLFRALKPDVVHTHTSKAGALGRFAAIACRAKVVHTVHIAPFLNVGPVQKFVYLTVEHMAGLVTHRFISVSAGMKESYRQYRIGREDIHHVVHSGMQLSRFTTASPPIDWHDRLQANRETRPFVILVLAVFEERKRQRELITALAPFLKATPDTLLCFGGDGPCLESAQRLVGDLGLRESVRFLGYDPRPEELIALADVCVLTSEREGLPRVLVQYVAARKRIVVMHLPGVEELLADYAGATVVENGAFNDVAHELTTIHCDKYLGQQDEMPHFPSVNLDRWEESSMITGIDDVYRMARNQPEPSNAPA